MGRQLKNRSPSGKITLTVEKSEIAMKITDSSLKQWGISMECQYNGRACRIVNSNAPMCTIDDAIWIMLGDIDQPKSYVCKEQDDAVCQLDFSEMGVMYELNEDIDCCRSDISELRIEGKSDEEIASAQTSLDKAQERLRNAITYKSYIYDEILKTENGQLNFRKVGPSETIEISLVSLKTWCKNTFGIEILPSTTIAPTTPIKLTIGNRRKRAILEELAKRGIDPRKLPVYENGRPSIKATIRNVLANREDLFRKGTNISKAFNNTWQEMLNDNKNS